MNSSTKQAIRPKVIFVILNWNQAMMTVDCLNSLYAMEYPNNEVIIVDNGSTDGSCELIAGKFPGVKLIQNQSNVGKGLLERGH